MGTGSVGGATNAAPVGTQSGGAQAEVATVRQGEKTLAQVADRVGYSESELKKANPQIKNPNQLNVGQDIRLPEKVTTPRAGEDSMEKVAKRLDVSEQALRNANPHIKDPNNLKPTDKINNPEYYERKDVTERKPPAKPAKTGERTKIDASDQGVEVTHPKAGKISVSPGGNVEYTPPKIGPVQPKITGEGVTPTLPQSKGDKIQNPKEVIHKPTDWKHTDPKQTEKLDKEQKAPGEKITDREIQKGIDAANKKPSVEQEFDARQALERLKNPIPKKPLRMRE